MRKTKSLKSFIFPNLRQIDKNCKGKISFAIRQNMTQIKITYEGQLRTKAVFQGQTILTDVPVENKGKGEMFSPTDLLATALGSCVLSLIAMAGQRLNVDLTGLRVVVDKKLNGTRRLTLNIYCPKTFPPDIQQKLESAGTHCPVHQSLHADVKQEFIFHWGEA
jgi:putative redox protein